MDKYNIVYTNAAANDIAEKFQYSTSVLHDRTTAELWHDLSVMPEKYPLYNEEPWHSKGVRLFITRQDVVVYSTDKTAQTVYIWNVFTAGRDLSSHIEDALEK